MTARRASRCIEARIGGGRAARRRRGPAPALRSGTCTFTLWQGRRQLDIEWSFDKIAVEDPESVFFAFPLAAEEPSFFGDFNGIPVRTRRSSSCREACGAGTPSRAGSGWTGRTTASSSCPLTPLSSTWEA